MSSTLAHQFDDANQQLEAATLGMWAFLATEVLFFGGMFLGYTVYRASYPAAFAAGSRHLDVLLATINTGVLLLSSLTMALAVRSVQVDRNRTAYWFLLATMGLGAVFLGIKFYEYGHKYAERLVPGARFSPLALLEPENTGHPVRHGTVVALNPGDLGVKFPDSPVLTPLRADQPVTVDRRESNVQALRPGQTVVLAPGPQGEDTIQAASSQVELFFSFYFTMTGFHALHMVIGMAIVAVLAFQTRRGRFSPAYYTPVEMIGLYWHFVDVVWVFLFPLLYLIDMHR